MTFQSYSKKIKSCHTYLVKRISADVSTIFAGRSKNAQINASKDEYRYQEKSQRTATKKPKAALQIAEVEGGLAA